MTANEIADHVAAVLDRLATDVAFVKELGIVHGMTQREILIRALRHSEPPIKVEPEVAPEVEPEVAPEVEPDSGAN